MKKFCLEGENSDITFEIRYFLGGFVRFGVLGILWLGKAGLPGFFEIF